MRTLYYKFRPLILLLMAAVTMGIAIDGKLAPLFYAFGSGVCALAALLDFLLFKLMGCSRDPLSFE